MVGSVKFVHRFVRSISSCRKNGGKTSSALVTMYVAAHQIVGQFMCFCLACHSKFSKFHTTFRTHKKSNHSLLMRQNIETSGGKILIVPIGLICLNNCFCIFTFRFTFFCVHRFNCVIPNVSLVTGIVVIFSIHVVSPISDDESIVWIEPRLCAVCLYVDSRFLCYYFCWFSQFSRRLTSKVNVLSGIEMGNVKNYLHRVVWWCDS